MKLACQVVVVDAISYSLPQKKNFPSPLQTRTRHTANSCHGMIVKSQTNFSEHTQATAAFGRTPNSKQS